MKKTAVVASALATSLMLASFGSQAQVPPDRSVKYRQGGLTIMANHVTRISAHVKGERQMTPAQLETSAAVIDAMAKSAFDGFIQATEQSKDTRAKPEIWKEWPKFVELQGKLQAETPKLMAAAKGGDVKALQAALGGVGGTCKACHDAYQAKEVIK
jgi:cytochrome c556